MMNESAQCNASSNRGGRGALAMLADIQYFWVKNAVNFENRQKTYMVLV